MAPAPLARLEDVRFGYGADAFELRVDSLSVAPGETLAVIGPSGTGKTTLVHLMAGVLRPDSGTVELAGERIDRLHDGARRARRIATIGMVFQEFELLEYLSALDNVLLPYLVAPTLRVDGAVRARATGIAARVGIDALLGRPPRRLSQGERQRVAIARALVTEPRLVLCDEPTGNLDPDTAGGVLDLLFEEVRRRGAAMVMVTHDHGVLDRFDRVVDVRELGGEA